MDLIPDIQGDILNLILLARNWRTKKIVFSIKCHTHALNNFLGVGKSYPPLINFCIRPCTGCPKKHGNAVTNWISSLLWISIVIPNFKIHNIIMSARVYFMKTVNGCKDVSMMSLQDEQWRRTSLYTAIFCFTKYNRMQWKQKQTN